MNFNAFIPAAGLGTRLYPLTKDKPKALVEIGGKPLLEHQLLKLKKLVVSEVVVNVHYFADQVIDFLKANDNFGLSIHISDERDKLLNTGGGLKKALTFLHNDLPVLMHNVDVFSDLSITELLNAHINKRALATLVVRKRETSRYLQFDADNHLCGWINTKTGEQKESRDAYKLFNYAFSGIQFLSPRILKKTEEQGAFSIIDLYLRLAVNEQITGFIDNDSQWMDLGKYEQIEEAEKLFL
ncbi:nucleotidyltransferase-like protein [Balneicella halophila]|uniref:Nucleotidyltransferase-like protein n=1 Tax=Balneicella halophila TaxID=1537566 RepID=A0A7L4UMW2_BALHA|nr:sugar phosphate nucleotidyltransferase [Balneicella halophila]PVX49964.1 nucleotidyltransferase-like protein [Balneicella halophila]